MTADLHRQASAIFDQACHLALADRSSYLDSACGSDAALRSHVEQLLAADLAAADTFLMEPAVFATAPFFESGGRQPAPTLVGRRLGNYDVGQQIGAGGMGTVFEARDRRLNRQVALKVLAVARHNDDDFVARFRREAHLASLLNHPNILSIYEADEDGGICFMATEFVAGKTLRELARQGPLPVKQLLDIASQAAFALAAAHEAGIVHRDIKPDNIMVRHDGLVKVLDFGLAKLGLTKTSLASAPSVKTKPGFIAGTAHYLSPEQALGKPASPGSDLFSLGVVLYELATGVRPFTGASELAVFNAILRDSPPATLRSASRSWSGTRRTHPAIARKRSRVPVPDSRRSALFHPAFGTEYRERPSIAPFPRQPGSQTVETRTRFCTHSYLGTGAISVRLVVDAHNPPARRFGFIARRFRAVDQRAR